MDPSVDELAARYPLAYEPELWQNRSALLARLRRTALAGGPAGMRETADGLGRTG